MQTSGSQAFSVLAKYCTKNVLHSMLGDRQCSNRLLVYIWAAQPSSSSPPDLSVLLVSMDTCWQNAGPNSVVDPTALQRPDECGVLGDLSWCPPNKNEEIHCNANDLFGLCHLPRFCEHSSKNRFHLFCQLPLHEEFLKKRNTERIIKQWQSFLLKICLKWVYYWV